jgi:protein phosphatase
VKDEELGPIMACLPPQEAAHVLVDMANLRGGPDNITAVVVKIVGDRIATKAAEGEPVRFDGQQARAPFHPAFWGVAGVAFLAAVGMLIAAQPILALLAACGGAISLAVGMLQKLRGGARASPLAPGSQLGRAPYVHTDCPSPTQFVKKLGGIVAQLRDAARREEWVVDWRGFDEHCESAAAASRAGQHTQALREYAGALRYALKQVRSRAGSSTGQSTVDE